jgi:hypothetical protein
MLLFIPIAHLSLSAQVDDEPEQPPAEHQLYLPLIQAALPPVQGLAPLVWDSRLTARGAFLVPATVTAGQGYWRLVEAQWFDHQESQGRHHIFIDSLDAAGQRQSNVPIQIRWRDGDSLVQTEEKAGEPFAANYAMYALAPAYSAQPTDGKPADRVEGMGLGEITEPHLAHHTSYGLIWRWTIAEAVVVPPVTADPTLPVTPTITGTPTVTVTPTFSATPTVVGTPTVTPTVPLTPTNAGTVTPSITPTPTPSATSTPSPSPTGTVTVTPTPTTQARPFTASVVGCQPYNNGSRFGGHVYVDGQPADGYGITFSYEPDGPKVPQQPAFSGKGGQPGYYDHILGAGVSRVGDWFAWLVDNNGERISTIAAFHTDGAANRCNNATVDFER